MDDRKTSLAAACQLMQVKIHDCIPNRIAYHVWTINLLLSPSPQIGIAEMIKHALHVDCVTNFF